MKAIELTSDKTFRQTEMPKPSPSQDGRELLVKVKYTALDTVVDYFLPKQNMGAAYVHDVKTKPLILGYHYIGTIVDKSATVADLKVGDIVFGHLDYKPDQKQGTLSEYIIATADECALAPKGVDETVVTASSTECLTALQALRDEGKLQSGQRVLILGGGGAVGSAAVSIAKNLGASHVTAVCSKKDVDKVRQLGADVVIDRRQDKNWKSDDKLSKSFDLVFDASSSYSFMKDGRKWLKSGGTFVNAYPLIVEQIIFGWLWPLITGKKFKMVNVRVRAADLDLLSDWLSSNKVDVLVDSVHPISKIDEAVKRHQNGNKKSGSRVVVKVDDGW